MAKPLHTPLDLRTAAAPGAPSAGFARLYARSDGLPYLKDSGGNEHPLTGHQRLNVHRDSFNRAAGAIGTLDYPKSRSWSNGSGAPSWSVTATGTAKSTAVASYEPAMVNTFSPLGRMKFTVATGAQGVGEWYGVFNWLDASNHYRVGTNGAGAYVLQKVAAGSSGAIAQAIVVSTPPTPANGDVVEIYRLGNDGIEVIINGTLIWTGGDSFQLAVDWYGLVAYRAGTAPGVEFDDWEFTPYDTLTVRDDIAWAAKGDLVVGSSVAYRAERLPVGTRKDQCLQVDSAQTLGVKWGVALTVGTTAPSSPATGDLWVDTN